MKIGLICNPHAGHKGRDIGEIIKICKNAGVLAAVTNRTEGVAYMLSVFKIEGVSVLFIYGGDGTVQRVLTAYFHVFGENDTLPIIVPLRGGTMNIISARAGIKRRPFRSFKRIMARISNLDARKLPIIEQNVLRIKSSKRTLPDYGFIFSLGLVTGLLKKYYQGKPSFGRAVLVAAKAFAALKWNLFDKDYSSFFEQTKARVWVDGRPIRPFKFLAILLANIDSLVFGLKPFRSEARLNFKEILAGEARAGYFNALAYASNRQELSRRLCALLRGQVPPQDENYFNALIQRMEIFTAAPYTIDGEIFESDNGRIECISVSAGPRVKMLDIETLREG